MSGRPSCKLARLFLPFSGGCEAHLGSPENRGKNSFIVSRARVSPECLGHLFGTPATLSDTFWTPTPCFFAGFPCFFFWSKTLRPVAKHYTTAGSLKHLVFLGKIHRKSPQMVNYYGDSKLLRRSIFDTAGSFEHRDCHQFYVPSPALTIKSPRASSSRHRVLLRQGIFQSA